MKRPVYLSAALIAILAVSGCSVQPSKSTLEEVITAHFEQRNYKVRELVIGTIEPVPMGQKQYMGTDGYTVHITTITLEFTKDTGAPRNYKKGQHITFHSGTMRIRRGRDQEKSWIVAAIDGIHLL